VLLLPRGVPGLRGTTRPLRDREVVFATYDASGEAIRARLVDLGASPRRAATVQTAVGVARLGGLPAVVPRSAASPAPRERLVDLPFRHRLRLDLVVPRRADPAVVAAAPVVRRELGLER
jgi:hypothetical protein